ncbi:MAG: FAD-binding oxidoreductase [Hyphomicrobium sp.]|nr:FAD-binding oxidoreductase [Hyphomicrobium sp.]
MQTNSARSSPSTSYDTIIVGQGLAGTTLAWCLMEGGQRVLVIDSDEPVTTSKIAGGLITPITGQRLALSWRVDEMLAAARAFYARVERRTGHKVFHERTATRLFASDIEREIWARRRDKPEFRVHLAAEQPTPLLPPDIGDASGGGFDMATAQLDVARYLATSRTHFDYRACALDWTRDVSLAGDCVTVAGHKAARVFSCEGYAATRNPYFSWVPFKGAKGDILTVRFDAGFPEKCLHRGIWIVPAGGDNLFRVGATYDWANLDGVATQPARAWIEAKLKAFIRVPYTVIDHQAAVRPVIRESKALIGLHPQHPRLGFFNGLGSKGSLHAPWFAAALAGHVLQGTPLPADCDVAGAWQRTYAAP